ncbi:MAG: hypothetical protein ABI026_10970 [Gemmatimonadaceae bacterium]
MRSAPLKWTFFPVIGEYERSPRALHQALADTPSVFVEIASLVYRGDHDDDKSDNDKSDDDTGEIADRERERASVGTR